MKKSTIVAVTCLTAGIIAVPTVASAANGGAWLLGRSNSESATTTVTNSAGTPLTLNAKSGYAPLKVNRTTKVTNLNADLLDGLSSGSFLRSTGKAADANKVDGLDSTAFAMRSGKTGTVIADDLNLMAVCPAGTTLVGGGGIVMSEFDGSLAYSGPGFDDINGVFVKNSWQVFETFGADTVSFAQCYSPSGAAVPGDITVPQPVGLRGTTSLTKGQQAYLGRVKELATRK